MPEDDASWSTASRFVRGQTRTEAGRYDPEMCSGSRRERDRWEGQRHNRAMTRRFGFFLSPLLALVACEPESTVADDVDALVVATAEVAVFLCECSREAEGQDPDACTDAAQEVLDDSVNTCIEAVVADDPSSREAMLCSTAALEDLLDCYEDAAVCPQSTTEGSSSGPDDDEPPEEDEPISDDACGLAFEADLEACAALPEETQDALDACLPGGDDETCLGEDC